MRPFRAAAVALGASIVLAGCVVTGGSDSNTAGTGLFLFMLVPVLMFFMFWRLLRGGRSRRSRQTFSSHEPHAPNRHMLEAELSVLSDDVLRLEPARDRGVVDRPAVDVQTGFARPPTTPVVPAIVHHE